MAASAAPRPGGPLGGILGLIGCIGLLVAYFLPWASLDHDQVREELGITPSKLKQMEGRSLGRDGDAEDRVRARELMEGVTATGQSWGAVLDLAAEMNEEELDSREAKVVGIARIGIMILPWVAGVLGVLLLLARLRVFKAAWLSAGPAGILIAFSGARLVAGTVHVLLLAVGILGTGIGLLLWAGVGENADAVGQGIQLMTLAGAACVLGGFFGFRIASWLRALFMALLVLAALFAVAILGV